MSIGRSLMPDSLRRSWLAVLGPCNCAAARLDSLLLPARRLFSFLVSLPSSSPRKLLATFRKKNFKRKKDVTSKRVRAVYYDTGSVESYLEQKEISVASRQGLRSWSTLVMWGPRRR